MPLQYSCFISYRHDQEDIVKELVTSLRTELRRWLELDVFLDEERLKGGDFFNRELAKALCESVCMIVVFTPTYFSKNHSYCAREYKAMEDLEIQRLSSLGYPVNRQHGLIIPIVYRGEKNLPSAISSNRQFYDFEVFQLSGKANLRNRKYAEKIRDIAEYVQKRCQELLALPDDPCDRCDAFEFPEDNTITDWLEGMLPPTPRLPGR